MSDTTFALTIEGTVATARFRTDQGLNVLSAAVLDQIAEVAARVDGAREIRAFVLAATGRAFVAGADIKELAPSALAVTLFALTEAVSIGQGLLSRARGTPHAARVHRHQSRCPKRTHQVLAGLQIDACLSSHGGVDHGK